MTYRFDPAEFMALRARLRCPPNAVPDKPIELHHPRGVTGFELERQRQIGIAQMEQERKKRMAEAVDCGLQAMAVKHLDATATKGAGRIALAGDYPTIQEVIGVVCKLTGVSVSTLKAKRRDDNTVCVRFVAILLAKILTLNSLPAIGRQFGGRDHTTILHAIRKMAEVERLTLAAVPPDATLLDFAKAAIRAHDAVYPGRSYPISEAVRALGEEQAA